MDYTCKPIDRTDVVFIIQRKEVCAPFREAYRKAPGSLNLQLVAAVEAADGDEVNTSNLRFGNGSTAEFKSARTTLEKAWELTNSIEFAWYSKDLLDGRDVTPLVPEGQDGIRSTSVGDYAYFGGKTYVAACAGWDEADRESGQAVWTYLTDAYRLVTTIIETRERYLRHLALIRNGYVVRATPVVLKAVGPFRRDQDDYKRYERDDDIPF